MFVLFDLDDTLHDKTTSLRDCAEAMFSNFLQRYGVDKEAFVSLFVAENTIIQPKTQAFHNIVKNLVTSGSLSNAEPQKHVKETLEADMLLFFDTQFHTFSKCFDQVEQTLCFLKEEKVSLACVTNGRDFFQRNKLDALGLTQYFDVILTSGELGVKKPDPIIFKHALEQLNADAKDCVFIGDSLTSDMAPAKALGMRTIWAQITKTPLSERHLLNHSTQKKKPDVVDDILTSYLDFKLIWQKLNREKSASWLSLSRPVQ